MTEKKRIACFFTGGYTELNAMKLFMKKINDKVEYIQLCPTGSRKSKDAIRGRHTDNIENKQNGLTRIDLINYVLDFVEKTRFKEEAYDAILIEDDKDDRFLYPQADGTATIDKGEWERFNQDVRDRLEAKCPGIPVLLFLAAPEVEAWFLSDWENSFGKVYTDRLTMPQNHYFSVTFRKYINDQILTQKYSDAIESYGYFDSKYRKLSEKIQAALAEKDFFVDYTPAFEHDPIRYSKRIEGETMLEELNPQVVSQHCTSFFKNEFLALQSL